MREVGDGAIDGRTTAGRALLDLKDKMIQDLGRIESVSTRQEALIDLAVRTKFMLDRIDAWLLSIPSLVNKRRRSAIPIVIERQQIAQALVRYLDELGLK
jgi:hypothetical protein